MSLDHLLRFWRKDPTIQDCVAAWQTQPARPACNKPIPHDLHPELVKYLQQAGVNHLYSHQASTFQTVQQGSHVVVVTSTASGKTLAYNLPILDALLRDQNARALYLFPTKALTQDQLDKLEGINTSLAESSLPPGVYDGDTPSTQRTGIRRNARILLTNPDMLHTGILPHHTLWAELFSHLRFVVLDELHSYRGVFGSHVANVLRRLRRVARYYGSNPQFIMTSATISNPGELAGKLIEDDVVLVDNDGAPHGEKHFIIYNPPLVNKELGIRRSVLMESVRLAGDLLSESIQTIVFGRSRPAVEVMLSYLRAEHSDQPERVRGYRSGYLPMERRAIEKGLREREIDAVVATTALELGIDIGQLEAAVLAGYPGTIAGTWQEAGRAGRSDKPALAVLITAANALDQFLARNPQYFFGRSPEMALIQPDNLLILLDHIRSAAFELPFQPGEAFGRLPIDQLTEFLQYLEQNSQLHSNDGTYFWIADQYPASNVSLRNISPDRYLLQVEEEDRLRTIGQVDGESAFWMVHPQAVYLHEGQPYLVENLDLEHHIARLSLFVGDYYTDTISNTSVVSNSILKEDTCPGCVRAYGELSVTTQVTGFKQIRWYTHEQLGTGEVTLPASTLTTLGYWLMLKEDTVERLRAMGAWTNDSNQYGPGWNKLRGQIRARDGFICQACGKPEAPGQQHDIHHKVPFRAFTNPEAANQPDNLVTLCSICHRRAELSVRMRSGLSGLAYLVGNLAPLFLMCDAHDIGIHSDPLAVLHSGLLGDGPHPSVVVYDAIPGGIGLSERLYELQTELLARALESVKDCPCSDGCPSCVGPGGEFGSGGKNETRAILEAILDGSSTGK
ncbi:MAG: DEAD/DEAH box helicase [Anaerolineaceae bacterium]|nr:DEAD/DEAH box helicase [Anaerolineaceae bacterium]